MAAFKPVLVDVKEKLKNLDIIDGQYIIVLETNELFVDRKGTREKVSQNIYMQPDSPTNAAEGDIWLVTEE